MYILFVVFAWCCTTFLKIKFKKIPGQCIMLGPYLSSDIFLFFLLNVKCVGMEVLSFVGAHGTHVHKERELIIGDLILTWWVDSLVLWVLWIYLGSIWISGFEM